VTFALSPAEDLFWSLALKPISFSDDAPDTYQRSILPGEPFARHVGHVEGRTRP
jgi:hypothetical protein